MVGEGEEEGGREKWDGVQGTGGGERERERRRWWVGQDKRGGARSELCCAAGSVPRVPPDRLTACLVACWDSFRFNPFALANCVAAIVVVGGCTCAAAVNFCPSQNQI